MRRAPLRLLTALGPGPDARCHAARRDRLALDACVRVPDAFVTVVVDSESRALVAKARGAHRIILAEHHHLTTVCERLTLFPGGVDALVLGEVAAPDTITTLTEIVSLAFAPDGLRAVRETPTSRETFHLTNRVALRIDDVWAEPEPISLFALADAERAFAQTPPELWPEPGEMFAPPPPHPGHRNRARAIFDTAESFAAAFIARLPDEPARELSPLPPGVERISVETLARRRPPLCRARAIVAGGRALGDAETFARVVGGLADALGAAVAASGGATAHGDASPDSLVGQSATSVAPDVYLALGISGVDQHAGGIANAKFIAAVNSDPDAPIFHHADIGFVGDLFSVVRAISGRLATSNLRKESSPTPPAPRR